MTSTSEAMKRPGSQPLLLGQAQASLSVGDCLSKPPVEESPSAIEEASSEDSAESTQLFSLLHHL